VTANPEGTSARYDSCEVSTESGASEIVVTSRVNAPPEDVWRRVTTPEGVNYELAPVLKMTIPRRLRSLTLETAPLDTRICRSWILFLGLIPVEFDDLTLAERGPGHRFLERSQMMTMRLWEHERSVHSDGPMSLIADRVAFELRAGLRQIPGSTRLSRLVIGALFRHRHRRLRRYFGTD
jgi:ligand-binding SRPBCC domain-containing protein